MAQPVNRGRPVYTEGKINCHRIPIGTSAQRKALLMKMCPELRTIEFNLHANKVSSLLRMQKSSNKSLDEQKQEFMAEVMGMAKSAGHLPTLQLEKRKR